MARNKIIFDSFELSNTPAWQFYQAHAPHFYAYKNNIEPKEAEEIFHQRLLAVDPYKDEVITGKVGSLRHTPYLWQVSLNYLKEDLFGFAKFHAIKTIPFFISDGLRDIAERLDVLPVGGPRIGDLFLEKDIKSFINIFLQNKLVGLLLICGASFWIFITLCAIAGMWRAFTRNEKQRALLIFAFLAVTATAVVAGGVVSSPRYRFSISPFLFLLASYGFWTAVWSFIKRRFFGMLII